MIGYFESCLKATKENYDRLFKSSSSSGATNFARQKMEIERQLQVCANNGEISKEDYYRLYNEFSKYNFSEISKAKKEARRIS